MLATATSVSPRRRELDFQLFDVLDIERLLATPHFAEHDRATLDAILDAAYDIAGDYFAPFAAELDAFEYRLEKRLAVVERVAVGVDEKLVGPAQKCARAHLQPGLLAELPHQRL